MAYTTPKKLKMSRLLVSYITLALTAGVFATAARYAPISPQKSFRSFKDLLLSSRSSRDATKWL